MRKGIAGIVVCLIGLVAWTGCGGGSSSLSKAEYQQQLELVCNKGLQEREEFLVNGNKEAAETGKKVKPADAIRKYIAVYAGTTEKIADIGLPEEDQKKAEELIKAREDAVAKVNEDPLSAVADATTVFAKANKAAEDLEVASCAK